MGHVGLVEDGVEAVAYFVGECSVGIVGGFCHCPVVFGPGAVVEFPFFSKINYVAPLAAEGKLDARYLKGAVAVKASVKNLKVFSIGV